MTPDDRWSHLAALDEELLKGGVILSEWCSVIVRETDIAFVHSAHLASILTAMSGIETYLRSEYAQSKKERLVDLIDLSPIPNALKENLHTLRKYRNRWVHIDEPWDDAMLLEKPQTTEAELEQMAFFAARLLRETIYENPWV
ncbi:hypothetical protein GGR73_003294 [Xanthomonas sp. F14]|nr:hypothetical protein [Xanthomonas arboricola]KER88622.1 hypothetical protein GW16_01085 [Xanthomonas arboricola pv. celebensis]NJC02938.1 hypothetical protein [Xanthomonas arboricola]